MLGLTAGATMMDDEHPCSALRGLLAQVAFDETEREINARRHSGRRPNRSIRNEDPVHFDSYLGEPFAEFFRIRPVRGRASAVQNPASASVNAAMQIEAMRLVVDTASRKYATVRGDGDTKSGPEPTMSVSKRSSPIGSVFIVQPRELVSGAPASDNIRRS